jgi:Ca-activated chloride channel family protein
MKLVFLASCLLFAATLGLSQDWKKDLNEARKLYKESKYGESLKKYRSAQKQAPKDVDLSDEIAQSSYKANEFEKAEKVYNQSSSKKGNAAQKARTYHNLGNSKLKQKKYDEAVEAYKESLRNNPNDEETRYNLSEALKKKKAQQQQENKKKQQQNQPPQNQNQPNQQNQQNKQSQNQQNQNQQQNQSQRNKEQQSKSLLSDKKTERMLDELVKREMETKKKLDGNKGKSSKNTSGKDW